MTGPLSDQHLDEIQARGADVGCPDCGCRDEQMHQLGDVDVPAMVAEVRRLHGERDHLVSAFDKLGDQMGELVQAARSERERYTAENRRLRGEIADAAGYLAVIHRHASRHDVLGENLGCAGCALLARIEGGSAP